MTKYEKLGNYLSYCTPHFAITSTYQVTCMIYRDNIFPDFIDMKFIFYLFYTHYIYLNELYLGHE